MMDHMGGMVGWMLLWGLIGLALLVLIVVAIIWLIRHMIAGARPQLDPAWDELRRRYAAGDIDHEEFARRKRDLSDR